MSAFKERHPLEQRKAEAERIRKKYPDRIEIIHFRDKPYEKNLIEKRQGHILIDDLAGHNTFHQTAIQGASFACTVFTGVGVSQGYPFLKADYREIEDFLEGIIYKSEYIQSFGNEARKWMEKNWCPKIQSLEYIQLYSTG